MNLKKFKEWYLHYFGIHSIAAAAAIMYAPNIESIVFTILHLVLFLVCVVMLQCSRESKGLKWGLNIILTLTVILNIILLFSASMGVGASGYDDL